MKNIYYPQIAIKTVGTDGTDGTACISKHTVNIPAEQFGTVWNSLEQFGTE